MTAARLITLLCLLLTGGTVLADDAGDWVWIHGHLDSAADQTRYLEFVAKIRDYYVTRGMFKGPLIDEHDLATWPDDHFVVVGPLAAFSDPDRFGLPLKITDAGVEVGAQTLDDPNCGIYLASADQTRVVYTGLSLAGFESIFTVPTGGQLCTVTQGRGQVLFETNDVTQPADLQEVTFLPTYPTFADVRDLAPPEGAVSFAPVVTSPRLDALDPAFASWLESSVADQRVLFFGEAHWNQGVGRIFQLIVEHLLATSPVRSVFLEVNYSFSGFFDHYINELDDTAAADFFVRRLHPLVSSTSRLELLQMLRGWNKAHADRPIHVGCLDMEWSGGRVLQSVVQPYFRRLDPTFTVNDTGEATVARLKQLITEAHAADLVGAYPFLTADYMDHVVTNLLDTWALDDFNIDRQRGIIRNITEFNADLLQDGLAIFDGGGWHAIKVKREGEDFYRDAAYLNEIYPVTKGRVVTLRCRSIGYSFAPVADIDLDQHMHSATNYNELVLRFKQALAGGYAERDTQYCLDFGSLDLVDLLAIRAGYIAEQPVLRIETIDWSQLEEAFGKTLAEAEARQYDATVYVLQSKIEVMRKIAPPTR